MAVRRASPSDIPQMVRLIEAQRQRYEVYQPVMWKRAAHAESATRRFFEKQLGDASAIALVFEQAGQIAAFLIAREIPTPPVFDPGGATVLVDDFCVSDPSLWMSMGRDLLAALTAERKATWRQVMVVCGDADKAKAALLADFGLTIASTWWTAPFPS